MTKAAVAADLHQTLHVLGNLAMKVALDSEVVLDVITQLRELFLSQIIGAGVGIDARLREDLLGSREADAVNIGQTDLDALVAREVDADKTCHKPEFLSLTLTLLMTRVLANHENLAMATNDLALVAHLLDRRTYLHN